MSASDEVDIHSYCLHENIGQIFSLEKFDNSRPDGGSNVAFFAGEKSSIVLFPLKLWLRFLVLFVLCAWK